MNDTIANGSDIDLLGSDVISIAYADDCLTAKCEFVTWSQSIRIGTLIFNHVSHIDCFSETGGVTSLERIHQYNQRRGTQVDIVLGGLDFLEHMPDHAWQFGGEWGWINVYTNTSPAILL